MAVNSLRYAPNNDVEVEFKKQGFMIYNGSVADFHEWEFRLQARYQATKQDERSELGSKVLESLRGDAFPIAEELGMSVLKQPDAAVQLIEAVRNHVFPMKELEAKELYKMGTSSSGILSCQTGETMTSYISRRRRWWKKLQSLNESISVSETIRADLPLEGANLDRKEKLMILTAVNDKLTIENVESTLVRQHNKIHVYDKTTKKENGFKQTGKHLYKKLFASGKPKAYLAGEDIIGVDPDEGDDLSNGNADDGDDHVTVACLAEDIGEAEDVELVELDVVAAFFGSDTFDEKDDSHVAFLAECAQAEATAYLGRVKGKGKGIPMRKGGAHGHRPRTRQPLEHRKQTPQTSGDQGQKCLQKMWERKDIGQGTESVPRRRARIRSRR